MISPGTNGKKLDGDLVVNMTDCTMSNYNAAQIGDVITGSVTNNMTRVTATSEWNGLTWDYADVNGTVTNNITDCRIRSFNGGGKTGGTIGKGIVNNVNGLQLPEGAVDYSCNFGGGAGANVINANTDGYAIKTTVTDINWDGSIVAGSSCGEINGNVLLVLNGGNQPAGRHLVAGNMTSVYTKTVDEVVTEYHPLITGDVTVEINDGSFGTVYLGNRNRTDLLNNYTDPVLDGSVTVNLYGGAIQAVRRGTEFSDSNGSYVCPSNVTGTLTVNVEPKSADVTLNGALPGDVARGSTGTIAVNFKSAANKIAIGTNVTITATDVTATAETPLIFTKPAGRNWGVADVFVAPGTDYEGKIVFEDGTESTVIAVVGGSTTTYTGRDCAIETPDSRTIVMGAKFTVRYLYKAYKIDFYGLNNVTVSYTVDSGDPVPVTLTRGTGDLADYYYFFVTGISAKDYNTAAITVTTTVNGNEPGVYDDTVAGALDDLADSTEGEDQPGDNAALAGAIETYASAMAAYFNGNAIPAVTATVDTDWIAEKTVGATASEVVLSEGIKAAGMNLLINDGVTMNFWVSVADGASIESAALGEATLANGGLAKSDRGNGYWVISYACGAGDLSTLLTLTVNGGAAEFKGCPLSYAEKLAQQQPEYADLAQAVIEYAYYVSELCD